MIAGGRVEGFDISSRIFSVWREGLKRNSCSAPLETNCGFILQSPNLTSNSSNQASLEICDICWYVHLFDLRRDYNIKSFEWCRIGNSMECHAQVKPKARCCNYYERLVFAQINLLCKRLHFPRSRLSRLCYPLLSSSRLCVLWMGVVNNMFQTRFVSWSTLSSHFMLY